MLPKFGFTNINRTEYAGVNLDTIQALVDAKKIQGFHIFEQMIEFRLATKNDLLKILGRGT